MLYEQLSEERKKLQAEGSLPGWFTTLGWQMFKDKYLYQAFSYRGQIIRIAETAAQYMPNSTVWSQRFFNLMWNGWLAPSTPVLANMGTERGMAVSCSGGYVPDSIDGFYSSQRETALLTQQAFGTSAYLGDIRPRGSKITGGGKASGILPVFKDFVQLSQNVSQGGIRRGAWAGYVSIEHDDFWELAPYVLKEPDDCNIGWNIHDSFIEKLNNHDIEAHKRLQEALYIKCVQGRGYFFFVDKVNRKKPDCYKSLNKQILASNLCVAPETMLMTGKGNIAIHKLENQEVEVWNGQEWSKTIVRKTGTNQKLLDVYLKNKKGELSLITCTPYHKFYDRNGIEIRAVDLKEGIELLTYKVPDFDMESEELTVDEVLDKGRRDDTFCVKEPKRGMAVFNYVLTGNCTEITLPSDKDHTFSCVLSSMNLAKYEEWKGTDAVFWATVFLDCVAQDFITKGSKIKGLEKTVRFTEKSRALGLGTLGFHTYLQQNNIALETLEAHFKNLEIYKHLHDESLRASEWMAKELGEPGWCKSYGVRNSHRTAIAPNTSSALLCGSVSQGIEPVYQNVYTQGSASGDMYRINPVLLEVMKNKGVYNKKVLEDIASKQGSVQHVDWLDEHQKMVFKTAFEIDQKTLIRLASTRQQYICQAQSLNLFFNADEDEAYIAEVHKEAFLDPNILSLYYMRSLAGVQTSKECISCEG